MDDENKTDDGVALALGTVAGLALGAIVWEWLDTCIVRPGEGVVDAGIRCAKTGDWERKK
jgi:hypothetical protein